MRGSGGGGDCSSTSERCGTWPLEAHRAAEQLADAAAHCCGGAEVRRWRAVARRSGAISHCVAVSHRIRRRDDKAIDEFLAVDFSDDVFVVVIAECARKFIVVHLNEKRVERADWRLKTSACLMFAFSDAPQTSDRLRVEQLKFAFVVRLKDGKNSSIQMRAARAPKAKKCGKFFCHLKVRIIQFI